MNSLARKLDIGGVFQEIGTVTRADDDGFVVRTAAGDLTARRAVSCLVAPELADRVLVAGEERGAAWVLAVLDRKEGARTTIVASGDLSFRVPNGRFAVAAQAGVDLVTGGDLSVAAATARVHAAEGSFFVQKLSLLSSLVRAEVSKVKVVAGAVDSVMDRISLKVKRSYRTVTEIDQLRAERVDYEAQKSMSLRGENTLVTAEKLVKVDGAQIHVG